MGKRVETTTNLAVLLVCGLMGYQIINGMFATKKALPSAGLAPAAANPAGQYQPGEPVPTIPELTFAAADKSLLLFVRSTCGFCTASMPFYKTLIERVRGSGGKVSVAIISDEPVATSKAYLMRHNISPPTVASVAAGRFKVSGTPTVLLVDKQGIARRVWRGRLAEASELELIETVFGKPASLVSKR